MAHDADSGSSTGDQAIAADDSPLRIFLNYRRDDAGGSARAIFDRLCARFGADNVFYDMDSLEPGMRWRQQIALKSESASVLLALIGPRWLTILNERRHAAPDDFVRLEIERALPKRAHVRVIPVLLGDASAPSRSELPRSLQPIADLQVARIRDDRFDDDVEHLIVRLEELCVQARTPEPTVPVVEPPAIPTSDVAPAPDTAHYDQVLEYMVQERTVVPVLGPGIHRGATLWNEESGWPPDSDELAAYLASRFGSTTNDHDLPSVAQYIATTRGTPDLFQPLKQILSAEVDPGPVHAFLAALAEYTEDVEGAPRHQLIVSTAYDAALEIKRASTGPSVKSSGCPKRLCPSQVRAPGGRSRRRLWTTHHSPGTRPPRPRPRGLTPTATHRPPEMISEITARSIEVSGQIASHSWPQNASDAASSSSCATGRRTTRAPRMRGRGLPVAVTSRSLRGLRQGSPPRPSAHRPPDGRQTRGHGARTAGRGDR